MQTLHERFKDVGQSADMVRSRYQPLAPGACEVTGHTINVDGGFVMHW